ncbi:MAG: phosphatidylglycerophosphatase A [Bacteroidia bacterium]|nr:phosphatidylglycerophosphatase A [Bacteroidia bacterium]MDW8235183.1 phosphatidylglycerophosphatase A [Bacteroidia bacterium]
MTWARLWASGFGTGYLPFAPATWGTLPALGIAYLLSNTSVAIRWAWTLLTLGLYYLSIKRLAPLPSRDPHWVVSDEMQAVFLLSCLYPFSSLTETMAAFFLFRFWDIVKLWPADQAEYLSFPWGILVDDIVAALYTWACLWLIFS